MTTNQLRPQRIKGALAFVCFSFFFFWLRVLDKADYSPFESTLKSTLNSSIVSYRIKLTVVISNIVSGYHLTSCSCINFLLR